MHKGLALVPKLVTLDDLKQRNGRYFELFHRIRYLRGPILRSLHWLPVRHRITFKIAVTVYKCFHGLAPPYLTEYCTPTSFDAGCRRLRSAYTRQLIAPRTRTSYGDRSFAVHGPVVWNSLPHDLRSTDVSLATFRNRLKTFLFDTDT